MIEAIIIALIIAADRITKILAVNHLKGAGSYDLIDGVLRLTYVENTGASFSMLSDSTVLLTIFSGIVIVIMILFLIKQKKRNRAINLFLLSISSIIGGAIGNLFDRIAYGYVVDFIDFYIINFAVFNIADCFITIGAVLFCACLIFDKRIIV